MILKYSKPGELVLDYFCGAGTTAVESKLLGRKCIALDINDKAVELAKQNVNFNIELQQLSLINGRNNLNVYEPEISVGDARDLSLLQDNTVDLICAHPPYANIIHYTDSKEGDLSFLDIDKFLKEMSKVAKESFRVLKPGRQCAILIGDTRRKKHIIPLGFKLIDVYLDAGFKLRELAIKRQYNCKTTGFWYANSIKYNFLLLAHEYLPIFEKPKSTISVRERNVDYDLIISVEKQSLKKKLNKLEATTVWIFPKKNFKEYIDKNIIDRYSNGKRYSILTFISPFKNEETLAEKKGQGDKQLLFIKSPFLSSDPSYANIEYYLKKLKKIVEQDLPHIDKGGFLIIQTQDVRMGGYIKPIAKEIIDILSLDNLWLKEIIFVTQEGVAPKLNTQNIEDYLEIVHQYLLVYDVKNEEFL